MLRILPVFCRSLNRVRFLSSTYDSTYRVMPLVLVFAGGSRPCGGGRSPSRPHRHSRTPSSVRGAFRSSNEGTLLLLFSDKSRFSDNNPSFSFSHTSRCFFIQMMVNGETSIRLFWLLHRPLVSCLE